jgi:hypothetical protein
MVPAGLPGQITVVHTVDAEVLVRLPLLPAWVYYPLSLTCLN